MQSCDTLQVQALVDGEIDATSAQLLRQHLGQCRDCQQTLEDTLLVDALAASHGFPEGAPAALKLTDTRARDGGRMGRRLLDLLKRWFSIRILLPAAATVSVAAGVILWLSPVFKRDQPATVFASILSQPRYHEWRLAYAAADQHRRYDGSRASSDRGQPLLVDLSGLERTGDERALAAAQMLIGMERQAVAHLEKLPEDAHVLNDRAAAKLAQGALDDALVLLDRALAQRPGHPQALWNKALVLERKGDGVGAAQLFRAVARLGEPGWSQEARARAGISE